MSQSSDRARAATGQPDDGSEVMQADRDALLAALRDVQTTAAELREVLEHLETQDRAIIGDIERGTKASELFANTPIPYIGHQLTERMAALEEARLRYRHLMVAICREEGLSIGEIARRWGFSRQLISRFAKGSRRSGPPWQEDERANAR